MSKFVLPFENYHDIVTEFLFKRADLILGDRELYLNMANAATYEPTSPVTLKERLTEDEHQSLDISTMLHEFTKEAIFYALHGMYFTIPDTYINLYLAMAKALINDSYTSDAEAWEKFTIATRRSKVTDRNVTFEDAKCFFHELNISIVRELSVTLPDDEMLTVRYQIDGPKIIIHTGERLPDVLYKKQYPEGRWNGEYHIPTAE